MRILLVEDEKITRVSLARTLAKAGHDLTVCETAAAALEALDAAPFDVVLTDLRLPRGSGMDVLKAALAHEPAPGVILMTAYRSVEIGGRGDQARGVRLPDEAVFAGATAPPTREAPGLRAARSEVSRLRRTIDRNGLRPVIGSSPAMRRLQQTIRIMAAANTTVLVEGESGTGKELVARELHRLSGRAEGPFVAVNCAAIPETLLESELFGHEKGSILGRGLSPRGRLRARRSADDLH